jgi:hypothetical protein
MKFLSLFRLELNHPYYADGRSFDFELAPAPETQRLLNNHRCILKSFPSGLVVLIAATDQNTPFIPLEPEAIFRFYLRPQNLDFALFTDLTALRQQAAPVYTNAQMGAGQAAPLALVFQQMRASERFTVVQPAAADRFTLSGRPLANLQLTDFTVAGLGSITHPAAYDAGGKIITVNSTQATINDTFVITYPIASPRQPGVLAEVEIHNNDSLLAVAAGPALFQIAFEVKRVHWKYFLVTDNSSAIFTIEDQGDTPVIFSPTNRTDLNENPDDSDKVARLLAEQYPAMQRFRFVSDELIACRQQPRKSLQLLLDGAKVLDPLPNPSLQNYTTGDALFQVVKYFSQ